MLGPLQALIARPQTDGYVTQEIARALTQGPWCWPTEAAGVEGARRFAPEGPPRLRPGQTILVTDDPGHSDLWALEIGLGRPASGGEAVRLLRKGREAWDDAVDILPRSLPVLWSSVERYRGAWLQAVHLVLLPAPASAVRPSAAPSHASREISLDGPSFGLSFLLALASLVLGEAVPGHLAASGALHPTGRIDGVAGLAGKINVLAREAPGIRRLLVASSQGAEAQAVAAAISAPFEVTGVASAAQAVDVAFGPVLMDRLVEAGSDHAKRRELVAAFFRLALQGRQEAVDWSPVARAADLALHRWDGLAEEDRARLELSRAIAQRHEYNEGRLPASSWLASLPAPVRVDIMAHYVQQSTDTGEPEPAQVSREALQQIVRGPEAFTAHLKLLGALGRLLAVTGDLARALEYEVEAARGFIERQEPREVSHPLAEWYRLAGALGDRTAFAGADAVRREVEALQGFGPGQPYVELARARALVALGSLEGGDAESTLDRLGGDTRVPSHVRWSAVRWQARVLEESGRDAAAVLAPLDEASAPGEPEARKARIFRVLVDMDRAARRRDAEMGARALEELGQHQPGLTGHLLRAARPGCEVETVARLFPY